KLLLFGDDSACHFSVADVPAGEWVSDARLSVPTARAAASGATLVPSSRREISRRAACRFGLDVLASPPSLREHVARRRCGVRRTGSRTAFCTSSCPRVDRVLVGHETILLNLRQLGSTQWSKRPLTWTTVRGWARWEGSPDSRDSPGTDEGHFALFEGTICRRAAKRPYAKL